MDLGDVPLQKGHHQLNVGGLVDEPSLQQLVRVEQQRRDGGTFVGRLLAQSVQSLGDRVSRPALDVGWWGPNGAVNWATVEAPTAHQTTVAVEAQLRRSGRRARRRFGPVEAGCRFDLARRPADHSMPAIAACGVRLRQATTQYPVESAFLVLVLVVDGDGHRCTDGLGFPLASTYRHPIRDPSSVGGNAEASRRH